MAPSRIQHTGSHTRATEKILSFFSPKNLSYLTDAIVIIALFMSGKTKTSGNKQKMEERKKTDNICMEARPNVAREIFLAVCFFSSSFFFISSRCVCGTAFMFKCKWYYLYLFHVLLLLLLHHHRHCCQPACLLRKKKYEKNDNDDNIPI